MLQEQVEWEILRGGSWKEWGKGCAEKVKELEVKGEHYMKNCRRRL